MARADVTLTVGVDPRIQGIDATARSIHDELSRASRAGVKDGVSNLGSDIFRAVQQEEPKVARAVQRLVNLTSRTVEQNDKLAISNKNVALTTDDAAKAFEKVNRLKKEGKEGTQELIDAEDEYRAAIDASSAAMSRHVAVQAMATRAENDRRKALYDVKRAQDEVANDRSFGQGLLSIGKYISALRAIAIPAIAGVTFGVGVELAGAAAAGAQGLLVLPAAVGAVAAGFGTLTVATLGFSDAIKDISDPDKFATALQNLSPNAQQAALAIQAIMEPLKQVKNATQDALFAGASEMINTLANTYLPTIQTALTGIAGAFNQVGRGIFDQLMTPETQASLQTFLNNVVKAFNNLAPAAGPLIEAFTKLTEVTSGVLPELAASAANAAKEFASFINEAAQSGKLEQWLRDGVKALGDLGRGAWALVQAFMSLAPTGQKVLPDIVRVLERIETIMPAIGLVATALGPNFGVWETAIVAGRKSLEIFQGAWITFAKVVTGVINGVVQQLDRLLEPVRWLIDKLNGPLGRILGGRGIPNIPNFSPMNIPAVVLGKDSMGGGQKATVGGNLKPTTMTGSVQLPSAGLPGVPAGGYPLPPPPAPKGGKVEEPPFYADPSLWSVDAVPVEAIPNGLASAGGLTPNAANLNNIVSAMFPGLPDAGGWRPPDGFNEHSSGEAIDFMVGQNALLGQQINDFILANADALGVQYTIWQQMMQYPDGRTSLMPDRGDATQNHMDHVHARVLPGPAKAGGVAFPGAGAGQAAAGMMGGYTVVDPEAVMRAEMALQQAKNDVEQKRLRLLELEAKGNASQRDLLTARNDVAEAENKYRLADLNVQQARAGKYKELDGKMNSAASGISQIGAALADDFGLSEGLPGIAKWITTFLANLAMAPMVGALSGVAASSPIQGGYGALGMMGARNMSAGLSPLGLSVAAPTMGVAGAAPGFGGITAGLTPGGLTPGGLTPGLTTPGAVMGPTIGPAPLGGGVGAPLPSQVAGSPGQGFPLPWNLGGGPAGGTPMTSRPPAPGTGGGFMGFGQSGIGQMAMNGLTAGLSMAGMAADVMGAGGAGSVAAQAAQTGIQVANRTAGYIGQLGGIAVGGLMETFLPNNSEVADPSKSWFGRLVGGLAGARPALPNAAGDPAPAQQQQQPADGQQAGGPMVKIDNINNYTQDSGQALSNQIGRMAMSGYAAGGQR